jgi:hypothetical protein
VWFKHKYLTNPRLTAADIIVSNAANDLNEAIRTNPPSKLPSKSKNDLAKLAEIFTQAAIKYSNKEASKKASLPGVERRTPGVTTRSQAQAKTTMPTRRSERSVTTEAMLSAIEMSLIPLQTQRLASRKFPLSMLCEIAGAVLDPKTGELMEHRHLMAKPKYSEVWGKANAKEIGRLAQGIPGVVEGMNTFFFTSYDEIPKERRKDITYAHICCNYRPEKADPHQVRITVGGDRINYPGDVGTPTADMLLVKLLFNSVISTKDAKFMSLDISNFYLETPMERYEYMRMKITDIPQEIVEQYNLKDKVSKDGYVFVEIQRGMYGLPQAGIIAQELLEK